VISVKDWAEIRRLHRAEGLPVRQVARVLGISRNTVRAALRSDGPPRYARRPAVPGREAGARCSPAIGWHRFSELA
jgi:transposase